MGAALTDASLPPGPEGSGITKRFPGVLANDHVSFAVKPGEIHALLGENGAGKSTLVKMIYGIMQPDEGEIRWNGQPMVISNPRAARRLGIGMVFQHFSLFEALTVLENIALGMDAKIPQRELEGKIREVMTTYGLTLDPRRVVSTLSVGERQRIEIVRALLLNPKLLIMDEPTSVLTPQEVDQLFAVLRQLASEGCAILYISHKLHEIKALWRRRDDPAGRARRGSLRSARRDVALDGREDDRRGAQGYLEAGRARLRRGKAGRQPAVGRRRRAVRRRAQRHQLQRSRAGRNLRYRRGGRQRAERAAPGARWRGRRATTRGR